MFCFKNVAKFHWRRGEVAAPFLHLNGQASGEMEGGWFLGWKISAPQVPIQNKEEKKIITTSYKHELNLSTTDSTVIHFVVIRKGLPPETRQKKKLRFKCNHSNVLSHNIHTYLLLYLYSLKNYSRFQYSLRLIKQTIHKANKPLK